MTLNAPWESDPAWQRGMAWFRFKHAEIEEAAKHAYDPGHYAWSRKMDLVRAEYDWITKFKQHWLSVHGTNGRCPYCKRKQEARAGTCAGCGAPA